MNAKEPRAPSTATAASASPRTPPASTNQNSNRPSASIKKDMQPLQHMLESHLTASEERKSSRKQVTASMLRQKEVRKLKEQYLSSIQQRPDLRASALDGSKNKLSPRQEALQKASIATPTSQAATGGRVGVGGIYSKIFEPSRNLFDSTTPMPAKAHTEEQPSGEESRAMVPQSRGAELLGKTDAAASGPSPSSSSRQRMGSGHSNHPGGGGRVEPFLIPRCRIGYDTKNRDAHIIVHEHLKNLTRIVESYPYSKGPRYDSFVALDAAFNDLEECTMGDMKLLLMEMKKVVDAVSFLPTGSSTTQGGLSDADDDELDFCVRYTRVCGKSIDEGSSNRNNRDHISSPTASLSPNRAVTRATYNSVLPAKKPFLHVAEQLLRQVEELKQANEDLELSLKRMKINQETGLSAATENMQQSTRQHQQQRQASMGGGGTTGAPASSPTNFLTESLLKENRELRTELRSVKRNLQDSKAEIVYYKRQAESLQQNLTATLNKMYEVGANQKQNAIGNGGGSKFTRDTAAQLVHLSNMGIAQVLSLPFSGPPETEFQNPAPDLLPEDDDDDAVGEKEATPAVANANNNSAGGATPLAASSAALSKPTSRSSSMMSKGEREKQEKE